MPVKPGKYDRVFDLVDPLQPSLQYCTAVSSPAESGNWEWLKEHADVCAPAYMIGCYGTDLPNAATLNDLRTLLSVVPESSLSEWTFADLDMMRHGRPQDFEWPDSVLAYVLRGAQENLGVLRAMSLSAWRDELIALADWESMYSIETWT